MNDKNKQDYINIGYIAGIIDGEGSIGVNIHRNYKNARGFSFRFDVEISSTDENLMKKLKEFFTDDKYYKKCYTTRPWRNPSYIIHLKRKTIEKWFPKIIPILVIKKQRAILLMEYLSLSLGNKYSEKNVIRCLEISKELKILNRRPTKEENILAKRSI